MCFQRCREKEEKQGTPAETAQVSEVDPGQAGCPGAVTGLHKGVSCPVKTLHWKELEGLPGGVDTTREYLTGGSHLPHVPLLHELAVRRQPALSGMLCDRSGKDRTEHPLQVRSDTASMTQVFGRAHRPMYQIYQCTQYPAGSDRSASCSLQYWGTTETWTKDGQENAVRLVITVKFLLWLENAVQEIDN